MPKNRFIQTVIAADDAGDARISTVQITEDNFEVGVKHPAYNAGGWIIVNCYSTKKEALEGHDNWVGIMSGRLGLPDSILDVYSSIPHYRLERKTPTMPKNSKKDKKESRHSRRGDHARARVSTGAVSSTPTVTYENGVKITTYGPARNQAEPAPKKPERFIMPEGMPRKPAREAQVLPAKLVRVLISEDGSWSTNIGATLKHMGAQVGYMPSNPDNCLKAIEWATHILLPGGADIHPSYYKHAVTSALVGKDPSKRDRMEMAIAKTALRIGLPILGICRGHQMLTVAAGGSLWQDLEYDTGRGKDHGASTHAVQTEHSTRLHELAEGIRQYDVQSYHHQATRRLPSDWAVSAWSADGFVEAIEYLHGPAIGVQYHPEARPADPRTKAIFSWLIAQPTTGDPTERTLPAFLTEPSYSYGRGSYGGSYHYTTPSRKDGYWDSAAKKWVNYEDLEDAADAFDGDGAWEGRNWQRNASGATREVWVYDKDKKELVMRDNGSTNDSNEPKGDDAIDAALQDALEKSSNASQLSLPAPKDPAFTEMHPQTLQDYPMSAARIMELDASIVTLRQKVTRLEYDVVEDETTWNYLRECGEADEEMMRQGMKAIDNALHEAQFELEQAITERSRLLKLIDVPEFQAA